MTTSTDFTAWGTARLWAAVIVGAAVLLLMGLTAYVRKRRKQHGPPRGGWFNGADNRWSTSKVAIVLWTIALLWAFVALLIRYKGAAVPESVPAAYLALLGIPSAGALGAKAITSGNAGAKTAQTAPTRDPLAGTGQLFSDDTGAPDLLDSQYFLFNLVLLGYFIAGIWHIADPKSPSTNIDLPALPGSLLALAGVSTATYLGKKQLADGGADTITVPANGTLELAADSDVDLPGGGTISLKAAGKVVVYPGVTYSSSVAAQRSWRSGGSLKLAGDGGLKLAKGAAITGPPQVQVTALKPTSLRLDKDSAVVDKDGAEKPHGNAPLDVEAEWVITLSEHGKVSTVNDDSELQLAGGSTVEYRGGAAVELLGDALGTVSAGATLGHTGVGNVIFPQGTRYVEAGAVKTATAGAHVALDVDDPPGIVLVEDTRVQLEQGVTITFPGDAGAATASDQVTATGETTIDLPSGGDVTIFKSFGGVSARAPKGSTISVDGDATEAGTVTPVK
jgi:hypothetical protein